MPNFADLILLDALLVDPAAGLEADAVAVAGERIVAVGKSAELGHLVGPATRVVSCSGCSILPGLIDGHAHMDREGLKSRLPSLAGAASIDDILAVIAREAASRAPGEWIVTMPVGTPPLYLDGAAGLKEVRFPDRYDLDRAAPDNPVYIRPVWGYWCNRPPLVSIANSRALALAGIGSASASPSTLVDIERDHYGEPTGRFIENTLMSVAEFTLMQAAPNFSLTDRIDALARSTQIYTSCGTTAVYEGHGVSADVISAYQAVRDSGAQTVRACLVISPSWSGVKSGEDVRRLLRDWAGWAARRGLGDNWLRLQGVYAECDDKPEGRLRAGAAPQTGWAGFNYDAGLPRPLLRELLLEAARNRMRVSTIFADVAEMFADVHDAVPISDLRWVRGHVGLMNETEVSQARDLGLAVVTHSNRHIAKMGSAHLARLGRQGARDVMPLRRLVDAGVPVALGSDNLPPSLFGPIADAVFRRDRTTGETIAEEEALTRREAFSLASRGGAWLLGRETELGRVAEGFLADLVVVEGDLIAVPEDVLRDARARDVIVGGRIVHAAGTAVSGDGGVQ